MGSLPGPSLTVSWVVTAGDGGRSPEVPSRRLMPSHRARLFFQGIFHFQLGRGEPMLHTRVRPHCREFLEKIARLYELHVFTFGSRLYAHTIAGGRLSPRSPVPDSRVAWALSPVG